MMFPGVVFDDVIRVTFVTLVVVADVNKDKRLAPAMDFLIIKSLNMFFE